MQFNSPAGQSISFQALLRNLKAMAIQYDAICDGENTV